MTVRPAENTVVVRCLLSHPYVMVEVVVPVVEAQSPSGRATVVRAVRLPLLSNWYDRSVHPVAPERRESRHSPNLTALDAAVANVRPQARHEVG